MKSDKKTIMLKYQNFFAGCKRVFVGFLLFSCCIGIYFGFSALFSYIFHEAGSTVITAKPDDKPQEVKEQKQYLSKYKSSYKGSDIYFRAYNTSYDPFNDMLSDIRQHYKNDKEFLEVTEKVHAALDDFLKKEIPADRIKYADSDIHFTNGGNAYPFVVYQLLHAEDSDYMYFIGRENMEFFEKLQAFLKKRKLPCTVRFEENFYYISYQGKITHIVRLRELKERIGIFSLLHANKYYISLILDDAGENLPLALEAMNLPYPVILSVWPQSTHAAAIAVLAHEKGLPVFLHQPMEALKHNGRTVDIGKSGLYVSMSYKQIRDVLWDNIMKIPYVQGINNHMGSKFTLDEKAVLRFLRAVREIKPYFLILDSLTVSQSKLYPIAKENEFFITRRDFFVDNESDKAKILQELDRAYRLAQKNKRVIIIGHVRKQTIEALKEWKAYLDDNIVFSLPSVL